ncbi:MAG: calcium-binding protein, partial [Shimia sp.]
MATNDQNTYDTDQQGGNTDENFSGTSGNDNVDAGAGQDTVSTGDGADRVHGQEGNDTIEGNDGADLLAGGGAGAEWQFIGGQWTFVPGSMATADPNWVPDGSDDEITGGSGADVLLGNAGNDTLAAGDGDDVVNGGSGDDSAHGGLGHDTLNLDAGNDFAVSGKDADILNGGLGNDTMYGDYVDNNMLQGGSADTFDGYAAAGWTVTDDPNTGLKTMSQTLNTEAGVDYDFSFDIAANIAAGETAGTVEVYWKGNLIDTVDVSSAEFTTHSVTLTGDGTAGDIEIKNVATSTTAQNQGPVIDTTGPVAHYDATLDINGSPEAVKAFAPGQANLYQVIEDQLKVFDTDTNTYVDAGPPTGFNVNAIGFNQEDDMIYGIAKQSGTDSLGNAVSVKDLVALDADGQAFRIGKTQVADYVGDFDAEGNLYTFQASVNRITKIDVDSIDGSGMMAQSHYYLPSNLVSGNTYDVAYNAGDNSFYGLRPPSSDGQPGTVIKIDMTNFDGSNEPVITEFTVGNTLIDGVMKTGMAKSAYGAIFLDGAGNLYAGLNRGDHDLDGSTPVSGAVYKIHLDEASGQGYAEHLADSQVSGYNDGAVDPRSVDPFAEKDLTSTVVIREPNFVASSGGDDQLRGGAGNDELHGGIL